jgi:hypothetical protein
MPFVTFTVRRGLSAADKSRLSEAMSEAQVAAGYQRADHFHRFLEVDQDDLLVDLRFPDYAALCRLRRLSPGYNSTPACSPPPLAALKTKSSGIMASVATINSL